MSMYYTILFELCFAYICKGKIFEFTSAAAQKRFTAVYIRSLKKNVFFVCNIVYDYNDSNTFDTY